MPEWGGEGRHATREEEKSFSLQELGIMSLHAGSQAPEFRSELNDTRPLMVRRFILTPLQESPALS